MVRFYAKAAGITIVLIGIGGLLLGNEPLFGVLNIDLSEDAVHLVTGGAMAGAGCFARDVRVVRAVVGGLGVVYLLVGILGIFEPRMFGLIPHGYDTVLDNLIHLALGVLGIAVAYAPQSQSEAHHPAG